VLAEPCPVWVRLSVVFDAYRPPDYRQATVRDTAFGVDLAAVAPGELLGWYRLNAGGGYWWGLVRFVAGSRNGRLRLALTQLVPATALQLRTADDPRPRSHEAQ
jgi:hypothetical protein